jgi:hypothetical protein
MVTEDRGLGETIVQPPLFDMTNYRPPFDPAQAKQKANDVN